SLRPRRASFTPVSRANAKAHSAAIPWPPPVTSRTSAGPTEKPVVISSSSSSFVLVLDFSANNFEDEDEHDDEEDSLAPCGISTSLGSSRRPSPVKWTSVKPFAASASATIHSTAGGCDAGTFTTQVSTAGFSRCSVRAKPPPPQPC